MYYTRWKLRNMFRDFWCNYLNVQTFADVYGVDRDFMYRALNIGRKIHNKEAEEN